MLLECRVNFFILSHKFEDEKSVDQNTVYFNFDIFRCEHYECIELLLEVITIIGDTICATFLKQNIETDTLIKIFGVQIKHEIRFKLSYCSDLNNLVI